MRAAASTLEAEVRLIRAIDDARSSVDARTWPPACAVLASTPCHPSFFAPTTPFAYNGPPLGFSVAYFDFLRRRFFAPDFSFRPERFSVPGILPACLSRSKNSLPERDPQTLDVYCPASGVSGALLSTREASPASSPVFSLNGDRKVLLSDVKFYSSRSSNSHRALHREEDSR